jgi:hypothetical protein
LTKKITASSTQATIAWLTQVTNNSQLYSFSFGRLFVPKMMKRKDFHTSVHGVASAMGIWSNVRSRHCLGVSPSGKWRSNPAQMQRPKFQTSGKPLSIDRINLLFIKKSNDITIPKKYANTWKVECLGGKVGWEIQKSSKGKVADSYVKIGHGEEKENSHSR